MAQWGGRRSDDPAPGARRPPAHAGKIGGYIDFGSAGDDPVELALAISLIDETQARTNLVRQVGRRGFDQVREETQALWRDALSAVEIEGGTDDQRIIFRSALYHTQLAPTELSESGGRYMGFDRRPHEAEGWAYHSDLSLWDTFRTLHPLLVLIAPERQRDIVRAMVAMYEEGGDLPKWAFMIGYTGGMIGSHADVVIADTHLKGITDFDVATAYQGMREHAMGPRPNAGRGGIEHYIDRGYCPNGLVGAGTSRTCEFAYDDWAIANLAQVLGQQSDHDLFMERSRNYRNVRDSETRFFRGRKADGSWVKPLRPTWVFDEQFIEGDAWQWRWFAPHDANGLIELFGSAEAFVQQLRRFFGRSTRRPDTLLPDPYYWHGNEPDIHAAYLFDDAGRPDLTQKWVRWIMKTRYGAGAAGLDGNDDYGTLSAWYVFSTMGLYPLAGSTRYRIGSPIFDSTAVHLEGGDLEIVAHDAGEGRYYIQDARIDDSPLVAPFVDHSQIVEGATLEFWMGDEPSSWGR